MGPNGPEQDNKEKLRRLEAAKQYDGPDRWLPVAEFLEKKKADQRKIAKHLTNWEEFDYFTQGLGAEELTIVSGIQGNGKSLFCRSLVRQFLQQNIMTGYISFEGSEYDTFKPFEYDPSFKLYVPERLEAGDPKWIIDQCYRLKAKYDGKIIILDHLHYIIDMNIQQNLSLNIGALLRTLITEACKGLSMSVILVAHQQGIDSTKTEPGIETTRDSSFLRQEPSNFITVHRIADPVDLKLKAADRTYDQGWASVKIDKCRRTGAYRKKLTFQKRGDWLEPL